MPKKALFFLLAACMGLTALPAVPAFAHKERQVEALPGDGSYPDADRRQPHVVVCKDSSEPSRQTYDSITTNLRHSTGAANRFWQAKAANWRYNDALWDECEFHDIQAAVDSVKRNTDILVMPGVYHEYPSQHSPDPEPDQSDGTFSYQYHKKNPTAANLIGIIGKENITLEGTGFTRDDVVIDADFERHVGIRADRADGFIARNFAIEHAVEHGLYTIDTDGYLYDNVRGSYSGEYQLFGYGSDHGIIQNCEAEGGGDSGIYVGGAPKSGRINTIVQNCDMHHNVIGFSGTNSNYVVIRDNNVYDNATGIIVDAESDHPNFYPEQQHIAGNRIWNNNFNVYSPKSNVKPIGFTRDTIHVPVGSGIVMASFSHSMIRGNWIWNNHTIGIGLTSLEIIDQGTRSTYDTIVGNWFTRPNGIEDPNGVDLFWDGLGEGNCWDNYGATSTPEDLPSCTSTTAEMGVPSPYQPSPENIAREAGLVVVDGETGELVCTSSGTTPCPDGPGPKQGDNTREGKEGDPY